MSISASMNAGVLGLAANATRLSTIADNLANASTVGYKRAEVQFASLVGSQSSERQYWAGGVVPSVRHAINEHGVVQATSTSTDFAVSGRGFLPVVDTTTPGSVDPQQDEFLLTVAGSFRTDADGFLRNSAGLYLHGPDPFALFREITHRAGPVDPAHAFYLGYEMAKAVTALTLGKQYTQDRALRWGFLTDSDRGS